MATNQQDDILKVVIGLFNAAPGENFLAEFVSQVENGTTIAQLADQLAASTYFTEGIMGDKVTTADKVAVLMHNFGVVASTDPASAGFLADAYFTDSINAGVGFGTIIYDAVTFLNTLSNNAASEFTEIATLLANKALVAEAYSANDSSGDLSALQRVVKNVTGAAPYTPADVAAIIASFYDTTAPVVIEGQTFSYIEAVNGEGPINDINDVIGKVLATDNISVTNFAITAGNDSGFFAIDAKGQLTLTAAGLAGAANDFESTPNSFALTVSAEDPAQNISIGQSVVITEKNNTKDDSGSDDPIPKTFELTPEADNFVGTKRNDTFNATYDGALTDTFNNTDILAGKGGMDTLNISSSANDPITLSDDLWTEVSGIEKIVMNQNSHSLFETSFKFNEAFKTAGVDLAVTSAIGNIDILMSTFTGDATVTAETPWSGRTYIRTGSGDDTVNATTGVSWMSIDTGAGDDTITHISGEEKDPFYATRIISGGEGADTIILDTGDFATTEEIYFFEGSSGITLATADRITNFVTAVDLLGTALAGDATPATGNYVEAGAAVVDYAAALTAANTDLATLNGTSEAPQLYSFQWDAADGYLFMDTDSDGSANQVVVLTGLTGASFAATDITDV